MKRFQPFVEQCEDRISLSHVSVVAPHKVSGPSIVVHPDSMVLLGTSVVPPPPSFINILTPIYFGPWYYADGNGSAPYTPPPVATLPT